MSWEVVLLIYPFHDDVHEKSLITSPSTLQAINTAQRSALVIEHPSCHSPTLLFSLWAWSSPVTAPVSMSALAVEQSEEWVTGRRYLDMEELREHRLSEEPGPRADVLESRVRVDDRPREHPADSASGGGVGSDKRSVDGL